MRFVVTNGNSLLYPSLTVAPSSQLYSDTSVLTAGYKPDVYKGTQLLSYDSCYRIMVYDNIDPVNSADVLKIVGANWAAAYSGKLLTLLYKYFINHMSCVVRKPAFCICENKDADQLRGNRKADQRLCFRYMDSTIPLLSKSEISSL